MTKFFESDLTVPKISLETIDFQTDSYAKDIEALYREIMIDIQNNRYNIRTIQRHPNVKAINDLTFKRTGIKLELVINSGIGVCFPFYPNPHSGILTAGDQDYFSNPKYKIYIREQIKIMDKASIQKGTIDTEKCRVSGIFSEYTTPIFINVISLYRIGTKPEEITAIFLHELGHCFSSMEYSNRLNSTNQVLATLAREMLDKDHLSKEYIFKELERINKKTTKDELDKIISGDNIILGRATMRYLKEMVTSQLPNWWYDQTSNETLADNFVSRWGYGYALVSALERGEIGTLFDPRNSFIGAAVLSIGSIGAISAGGALTASILHLANRCLKTGKKNSHWDVFVAGGVLVVVSCLTLYLIIKFISSHTDYRYEMTYDDTKNRYQRIRNEIVNALKNVGTFSDEQIKVMIKQIKTLDRLMDQRDQYRNIITVVMDMIKPSSRDHSDSIDVQRLLENLSSNDLYVSAASLRTM